MLLNRAVAIAEVDGPRAALDLVDELTDPLSGYRPYFAVRANLLRRQHRTDEARTAYDRAIALAGNGAERDLLTQRRDSVDEGRR